MSGKRGQYSYITVYDERRRYYYLWPQRNKPFLDDDIRNAAIGQLDQIRRSVQHTYGDVAVPLFQYSGFVNTSEFFKVQESSVSKNKNFEVVTGGSLDHPAVLYAKGFYIFLSGGTNLQYNQQMYTNSNSDLAVESDKSKTISTIPSLTTPSTDRIDIVYAHLHFEEVTAQAGTDSTVYRDTNLKNPVVGTETANRLRAVFDILVREAWTDPVDQNIFTSGEFLGGIPLNDFNPTDNDYKIPIAVIYRHAFQDVINNADIVDLLSLYNKRIFSLEESSYRIHHGGYVQQDVDEKGYSGFSPQFPEAEVDESAFATGLNMGIGTRAFNSNSVTPRVLDNDGKFFMDGLMVGHDTGIIGFETGSEGLNGGEIIAQSISTRSLYAGYGVTGITGIRGYTDILSVAVKGETGKSAVNIMNIDGETGSVTMQAKSVHNGQLYNYLCMDYRGRVGLNTFTPGWSGPDSYWNPERYNDELFGETGVNIVLDVNGSARITDHLFVDKDAFVQREMFGKTWRLPAVTSPQTPALFGFTGIPQSTGFTGSVSNVMVRRGIAVIGESGIEGYGYTGAVAGQYECYDQDGKRMFTIGDIGDDFDRVVKSLYGTGVRKAFLSDNSFLLLPNGYGEIQSGDTVTYDIQLEVGSNVTGSVTVTQDGIGGVEEIRDHIMSNPGWPNGVYERTYSYTFYHSDGSTETKTGTAYGVTILEDTFGFTLGFDNHGRLILKDIPEAPVEVELRGIISFTVRRTSMPTIDVKFTETHYIGSTQYGGDTVNIKFAKLDLGEGADGWLFNGDVFFNSTGGLLNRVTFSPNVVFRDDVFIYGTLYADQLVFNFANVHNLNVRNNLFVENRAQVVKGSSVGDNSLVTLQGLQATNPNLLFYVKGDMLSRALWLRSSDTSALQTGLLNLISVQIDGNFRASVGGELLTDDEITSWLAASSSQLPLGIHIVDTRPSIDIGDPESFKSFVLDYSDGFGNYGNVNFVVRGDLNINRNVIASHIGCGDIDTVNTDYAFSCNGRAQINDVLEVKALRFIGAEAPEGITDISTPSNIFVVKSGASGGIEYQNANVNILRNKEFTSQKRIYLSNSNNLGDIYLQGETGCGYYDNVIKSVDNKGRWAKDTTTYSRYEFDTITGGTTDNEIIVANITDTEYKKFSCERVTIATVGTLNIEWSGYKYDPTPIPSFNSNPIQSYIFTSPYFRNRDGGINIDWGAGASRFGDDNIIAHVKGQIIDTHERYPKIYSVDKSIGIYIPKDAWDYCGYMDGVGGGDTNYRSFVLFYKYESAIGIPGMWEGTENFNIISFDQQTTFPSGTGYDVASWKLALYPRLVRQYRIPVGSNKDQLYQGEWDIDLVILPEDVGRIANLTGKLYISYMQS